jgi:hypothetical protein
VRDAIAERHAELHRLRTFQGAAVLAAQDAITAALPGGVGFDLIDRYSEAANAQWLTDEDILVEAIAAHLPGLAPAIRVVWAHIREDGVPDPSLRCCTALPTP